MEVAEPPRYLMVFYEGSPKAVMRVFDMISLCGERAGLPTFRWQGYILFKEGMVETNDQHRLMAQTRFNDLKREGFEIIAVGWQAGRILKSWGENFVGLEFTTTGQEGWLV